MISLLPKLGGLQNSNSTLGEAALAKGPLAQVIQEHAQSSGNTFTRAFSHVFREQAESFPIINQLQTFVANPSQKNEGVLPVLPQIDEHSPEALGRTDVLDGSLGEFLTFSLQTSAQVSVQPVSVSGSEKVQVPLQKGLSSPVDSPATNLRALEGALASARQVSPDLGREGEALNKTLIPVANKALKSELVSLQAPQEPSAQRGQSVQENEALRIPILPRFLNQPVQSQSVRSQTPFVTAQQTEGPAVLSDPALVNQSFNKSILGNSLALNTLSGQAAEHQSVIPADLPGDTGLLSKGERIHTNLDSSIKTVNVDPGAGQGLGAGLNQFSQSQSGFQQQQSSLPGQGVSVRALEERSVEFPAQALQRLQIDVQLSEHQRVQIDVGVQNRQVYAGLVMDHSVLRNLAAQFVPQLENQLSEVDLELQEFSAEVREEREQDADALFRDSRFDEPHEAVEGAQDEPHSPLHLLKHHEGRGLHFVA
jgi:hypothetical protein